MNDNSESVEYEIMPPYHKGDAVATHVKHRKSYRLFFFPELEDSVELLYCSNLFEVYWLKLANYQCRKLKSLGIEYVRKGSLTAVQNGISFRIGPGEIFLEQPDEQSSIRTGPEGYCEKTSLLLSGEIMRTLLTAAHLEKVNKLTGIDRARFELLLEKFKVLSAESPRSIRQKNGALCYELLHFLQYPEPVKEIPEKFVRITKYLHQHLDRPLTLEVLSEMSGCSPVHFIREFSLYFGTTPGKYIHSLRMTVAAELLLDYPELSVKEITEKVGYANALNFSTAFRNYYKFSPQNYRKAHSANQ